MMRRAHIGLGLVGVSTVALLAACYPEDPPIPLTEITRMQAFKCVVPGATVCQGRGDAIPAGELPPTTEGFQVWVWHPGINTTAWRLLTPDRMSDAVFQLAEDSVGQPVNLFREPDTGSVKDFWVRAVIIGVVGTDTVSVARDSLFWHFP